jgi:aminomethyltransferase
MKKTPLYNRHVDLGAKLIDFHGWTMPVQYSSVIEEHRATRERAGLFDICHMGEIDVKGSSAFEFLQQVMSRNLEGQEIGQMKLSVMTTEEGGIMDDLTIYLLAEGHYRVVTNSATVDNDYRWMQKVKEEKGFSDLEIIDISDQIGGIPAILSRSGYTGESGFEIYTTAGHIGEVWDMLLEEGNDYGVLPAGLGARDTLRLESGYMLYGSDMDESTTPLEVVYGWITNLEKDFIGSESLRKQKEQGVVRKLVGFEMDGRGIARHGYKVLHEGHEVGVVTSGTFAPTVGKAIGMAFVPAALKEPGTRIEIQIRSNPVTARVVNMPFYKRHK